MMSLASLTRQLGRVCLKNHPVKSFAIFSQPQPNLSIRSYTASTSLLAPKSSKNKKITTRRPKVPVVPPQHQEWLSFQESISVEGFESVNSSTASTSAAVKEREDLESERARLTQAGGGLYPPLRYSPTETERLLREAYETLPVKAGPRGTRAAKRQMRRWMAVRKIRKKYKKQMIRHHEKKMVIRSLKIQNVKKVLTEAPDVRERDREYQAGVFRRWAETMTRDASVQQSEAE
jgi:hypothetical protein